MRMAEKTPAKVLRYSIKINGIVQGVGFRPFVYNAALSLGLKGFVKNTGDGVYIEAEGTKPKINNFISILQNDIPPLSEIFSLNFQEITVQQSSSFEIQSSGEQENNQTFISPDVTVCNDCLHELFDPDNRRSGYPFINCTNCGPRYTIIKDIPYDRPLTTMASFTMCPECQREYDDPLDRRFHAQPNACPVCGPHLCYETPDKKEIVEGDAAALERTVNDLLAGKIIAVKGLGGFHLAVNAFSKEAVSALRKRKNRYEKPLAVMAADLQSAKKFVHISGNEEKLLAGFQRPIVLLRKKTSKIADNTAPANKKLGIMLPYTPLHHLLMNAVSKKMAPAALVMTSANISEEPIAIDNDEARRRLGRIADGFLMHNRDILIRADDSVLFTVNDKTQYIRRSRGYTPRPIFLKQDGPDVLALGGQLKNTICIIKKNQAFVSQHIGDLENLAAFNGFKQAVDHFRNILKVQPDIWACDMHPGYSSTQWAEPQKCRRLIKIQHHHAHMASVMAEHQLDGPVIGLILDGTGYGYDGTIWGGEILVGDYTSLKRAAWLKPVPMPGGEAAIHNPWQMAVSCLYSIYGENLPALPFLQDVNSDIIIKMLQKNINSPLTSSCGRLFDAVSAISGGRKTVSYEAQAAVELMQAAEALDSVPAYNYQAELPVIDFEVTFKEIVDDVLRGGRFSEISARFHKTLILQFDAVMKLVRKESGLNKVVLSGGVFQNEILLSGLLHILQKQNVEIFIPKQVPANDGGISLGQAAIAQRLAATGKEEVEYFWSKS